MHKIEFKRFEALQVLTEGEYDKDIEPFSSACCQKKMSTVQHRIFAVSGRSPVVWQ